MGWLEGAGQTHRLTLVRRTNQQGLLAAALAVRQGQDVKSVLTANTFNNRTTWNGAGFRLLDTPATNANHALLTWSIANDIAQRHGPVVILTPDAGNTIIRAALNTLQTKQHTRKNGATFGPYPHTWDRHDNEEADALLADIALPEMASCADLRALLTPLAGHAPIAQALSRMDRLRRAHGQAAFTAAQVTAFVREVRAQPCASGFPAATRPSRHDDPARQEPRVSERHRALAAHRHRQRGAFAQVALQRHHARAEPLHRHRARPGTAERSTVRAGRCLIEGSDLADKHPARLPCLQSEAGAGTRRHAAAGQGAVRMMSEAGPASLSRGDGAVCRILSLDGGGAKGFYTLGVLKEIEGLVESKLCEKFDLVFGTSTGAIIAALVGLGFSVDDIAKLYRTHVVEIMGRWLPSRHFSNRVAHRVAESGKSCFARTTCADLERRPDADGV